MKSQSIARTALASVAIGALLGSAQLMADVCHPVKGKILNSLHVPALGSINYEGGVSTVGVVALNGGKQFGKLKCALVGVVAGQNEPPALDNFTHTISCDDSVASSTIAGALVHSQLTFDTTGYLTGPADEYGCAFSFEEQSVPQGGTGKGVFAGNTNSRGLAIEGTANFCTGSIDMNFTGDICLQ